MIKKIALSLMALLSLSSCQKSISHQFCVFLDEAKERVEDANSLNEIKAINDQLIKNISIYSMSLQPEEYKKWEADPEAQKKLEEATVAYNTAKQAREKALHSK